MAVDGGGNTVVRGAHERQALLDRAHPRLVQVLARPGGIAEPAIVGEVEHERRPLGALHDLAREDGLVADERRRGG